MTDQFRKISIPAENRMRTRTAKEQLEAALLESQREQKDSVPDDAEDESARRERVLT